MKGVFSVKTGSSNARGRGTTAASATHFLTMAAIFRSGQAMSRGSVESRMSDGMELACSNVGQDRQQQRCDDVNCWIGTDDEQKIRENGLDEFGQGSDDDGVVEFPDREKDWNNVDADKSSNATNQGKQSDDEAEFEEPRKNGEGVEKVREIGDAFDFCDPDRGVLDQG